MIYLIILIIGIVIDRISRNVNHLIVSDLLNDVNLGLYFHNLRLCDLIILLCLLVLDGFMWVWRGWVRDVLMVIVVWVSRMA